MTKLKSKPKQLKPAKESAHRQKQKLNKHSFAYQVEFHQISTKQKNQIPQLFNSLLNQTPPSNKLHFAQEHIIASTSTKIRIVIFHKHESIYCANIFETQFQFSDLR
jgi:hypothetical protein